MRGRLQNRQSYNAIAPIWDAARTGLRGRELVYLDALLAELEAPARVLDLGCGTGRPLAAHLLARGHRVTGIDQAEAMIARARRHYPDATWIHGRLETFVTKRRFDAIVCWDALFHIPRAAHAVLFGRFARMLRPGGRLMLSVGGSAHPPFTDTMHGHRFFYDSHPPGKALEMLVAAGFRLLLAEFTNQPTAGRDKGRYAIVASRA